MKRIAIILIAVGFIAACGNSKDSATTAANSNSNSTENSNSNSNSNENANDSNNGENLVLGFVRTSDEGCPLYIEVRDRDGLKVYPTNLEDKFKVDGLLLRFSFGRATSPAPETCEGVSAVSVANVAAMR